MKKIPIECKSLDKLLNGGIEPGIITLLYGEGGCGKTNICLQLARNVSRTNKVMYIDTEEVSIERLRQICGNSFENNAKNIIFYKPYSLEEQAECVEKVVDIVEEKPDFGLVILDSATIFYRLSFGKEDSSEGRSSLTHQITKLYSLARRACIPVVLTTQVYTDLDKNTIEPIGGQMLFHNSKTIIKIEKIHWNRSTIPILVKDVTFTNEMNKRIAKIMKHRALEEGKSCYFSLTEKGVE